MDAGRAGGAQPEKFRAFSGQQAERCSGQCRQRHPTVHLRFAIAGLKAPECQHDVHFRGCRSTRRSAARARRYTSSTCRRRDRCTRSTAYASSCRMSSRSDGPGTLRRRAPAEPVHVLSPPIARLDHACVPSSASICCCEHRHRCQATRCRQHGPVSTCTADAHHPHLICPDAIILQPQTIPDCRCIYPDADIRELMTIYQLCFGAG